LLVFDTLVHGQENIEIGCFRGFEKLAVAQSSESCVASRLAIVTGQRVPESLIDTFVDQNAHLGVRKQEMLCFFKSSDGGFSRDCGKSFQKVFECFSALEVVEECLDGHPRSAKHRSSAKNIRVFDGDSHERIVSRAMEGAYSLVWNLAGRDERRAAYTLQETKPQPMGNHGFMALPHPAAFPPESTQKILPKRSMKWD
jgi:hypothetical protein